MLPLFPSKSYGWRLLINPGRGAGIIHCQFICSDLAGQKTTVPTTKIHNNISIQNNTNNPSKWTQIRIYLSAACQGAGLRQTCPFPLRGTSAQLQVVPVVYHRDANFPFKMFLVVLSLLFSFADWRLME